MHKGGKEGFLDIVEVLKRQVRGGESFETKEDLVKQSIFVLLSVEMLDRKKMVS